MRAGWRERWVWIREIVDVVGEVARRVEIRRVVWVVRAWRVARCVGGCGWGDDEERRLVVQFVSRVV